MKIVNIPIEMIACFSKNGIPHPLKFKMSPNLGNLAVIVKVDIIIHRESEKIAGNAMYGFRCQSLIDDAVKIYELKYELSSCKWFIYKM